MSPAARRDFLLEGLVPLKLKTTEETAAALSRVTDEGTRSRKMGLFPDMKLRVLARTRSARATNERLKHAPISRVTALLSTDPLPKSRKMSNSDR